MQNYVLMPICERLWIKPESGLRLLGSFFCERGEHFLELTRFEAKRAVAERAKYKSLQELQAIENDHRQGM